LERALFAEFYALYAESGFPSPEDISVLSRENTGGGRYVRVTSSSPTSLADGYYDLGGKFIEMQGLPNGLMAVARVLRGGLREMEIAVYGGDYWDGVERAWSIR